jgi:hypothetical protein
VLVHAGICCRFVVYTVERVQSRMTVWHGQSKGFMALLLSVEDAWVQLVM